MAKSKTTRRSPGRPPASQEHDIRSLLLTTATDLFARQGVGATAFSRIATNAGVTPAMLHYYFQNREQLLDAVVDERIAPILATVWNPVKQGVGIEELLSGIVDRMLEAIAGAPWIPSTWMREVLNENGLLRQRMLTRLPFDKLKIVANAIQHGQVEGSVNADLNPQLTVFSLIGNVMVHLAMAALWPEVFPRKAPTRDVLQRHIKGLLLRGLQPPNVTGPAQPTTL